MYLVPHIQVSHQAINLIDLFFAFTQEPFGLPMSQLKVYNAAKGTLTPVSVMHLFENSDIYATRVHHNR